VLAELLTYLLLDVLEVRVLQVQRAGRQPVPQLARRRREVARQRVPFDDCPVDHERTGTEDGHEGREESDPRGEQSGEPLPLQPQRHRAQQRGEHQRPEERHDDELDRGKEAQQVVGDDPDDDQPP
jgi:hypothetical protein